MKILVFDNYDSFTYNLVHLIKKIVDLPVDVYRNNEVSLEGIAAYDKIILSPGPGIPEGAGLLIPLIKEYAPSKSILGVCLGHQAIAQALGGSLINLSTVYHGIATDINITTLKGENGEGLLSHGLFKGLPSRFPAGRYHSWIVNETDLPGELEITARDENGFIMALEHKKYDLKGVQFHPESVLSPCGEQIIRNWLFDK